jgi:type II secretory pathway component PulF
MQQRRAALGRGLGFIPFYRLYPLILGLAFLGIGSMLRVFVMPQLMAIFKDFKLPLPWITLRTLEVARFSGTWLTLLLAVIFVALLFSSVVARYRGSSFGIVEGPGTKISNALPVVGTMRMHRALGDALELAADALDGGRPIETALSEASQICGNSRLRLRMDAWITAMVRGQTAAKAAQSAGMPQLVYGMLATALHTPDVAEVFRFLGRYYSSRFSRAMAFLEASIIPLIALVGGLFVGWLALAVFTPMVKLLDSVAPYFREVVR